MKDLPGGDHDTMVSTTHSWSGPIDLEGLEVLDSPVWDVEDSFLPSASEDPQRRIMARTPTRWETIFRVMSFS
jgi:hypothetical protein